MRDLRKYARSTTLQLALGGLFILVTVGLGLIYVFYGLAAALSGLLCLLAGLAPLLLIALSLWLLEIFVRLQNK